MPVRARREPPSFRRAGVVAVAERSPRMIELRLSGPDLSGFVVDDPAASVRLLVPRSPGAELTLPRWNGNEFLDADGERPALRTFTPLHVDPDRGALTVQVVRHGPGAVAGWAELAEPGWPVAVSGPGRGHRIDPAVPHHLLLGDETAIPAISQLLAAIPAHAAVQVTIEVAAPGCELPLPHHPRAAVRWVVNPSEPPGTSLVDAARAADLPIGVHVWAAGEAAAVQAIRRHLFDERILDRSAATLRGYWKQR